MESDLLPWPEKHRPKSIKELVGNTHQLHELSEWLKSWTGGIPKIRAALLIGPPGVGKTTAVYALANDMNLEIVEFNASDSRNKSQIETLVGRSSMQQTLDGSYRLILLDEVDGLSGTSDRGGAGAIEKIVGTTSHPIIMTANDPESPRLKKLQKICRVFTFATISQDDMLLILKRILAKQEIDMSDSELEEIIYNSGGDLRAAISDLELIVKGGIEHVDLSYRDIRRNIIDTLSRLFMVRDMNIAKKVLSESDTDHDTLLLWIEENIHHHLITPEELESGLETLSQADLYLGRIWKKGNWRFLAYFYDILALGIPMSRTETPYAKTSYSQSKWPLLMWRSNMNERKQADIRNRLARAAGVSKKRVARTHQDTIQRIVNRNPSEEAKFTQWLGVKKGSFVQRGSRRSRR